MRVLIIGGTGFIGPHVVRRLTAEGHEVTVAHTGEHEVDLPSEVEHVHHPLLARVGRPDLTPLRDGFRRIKPDVVLDMFPLVEADANAVVAVIRGIAGRVVGISSQDVYRAYGILIGKEPGPPEPVPLTEDSPLRQHLYPNRGETLRATDDPRRWDDDYDKIPVERIFLGEPDLPGTILRLPAVYGANDGHRIFDRLKRMDDRRPVILMDEGSARWRWTWGYVENVALAIALAVVDDRARGRIYNIAEPEFVSQIEWVRRIGRIAGWNGNVVIAPKDRLPKHLVPTVNTDQDVIADSTRIRRELGFAEIVPQDEALRRTIEWERAHPPETIDPAQFDYAAEDAALAAPA